VSELLLELEYPIEKDPPVKLYPAGAVSTPPVAKEVLRVDDGIVFPLFADVVLYPSNTEDPDEFIAVRSAIGV